MSLRSTFTRPTLAAMLMAGFAFGAIAQTSPQAAQPETGAKDKDKAVAEASFGRADANGDGKVSKEEAAKLPAIAARFDELDKNKDGVLSPEEFAAGLVSK